MNAIEYLEKVSAKIDNLSDEEFLNLLKKSGIDDCPYEVEFSFQAPLGKKLKYSMRVEPVIVKDELKRVA